MNSVKGQEVVIKLPEGLMKALADYTQKLGESIRDDSDIKDALSNIAKLAYISTGNGYYLYKMGKLEL